MTSTRLIRLWNGVMEYYGDVDHAVTELPGNRLEIVIPQGHPAFKWLTKAAATLEQRYVTVDDGPTRATYVLHHWKIEHDPQVRCPHCGTEPRIVQRSNWIEAP
ncbi:hypothetical protein [Nocardia puris]|uniref:Uncharacterized protein n=1 Tax=Nocardia puris TaxID=208602 RepID=A0A366DAF6_9NOCA|nr:hypothetical protein [Nocardia puris]RBO87041.1 hypothetical protein DFR74_112218 [Nocardia puris]